MDKPEDVINKVIDQQVERIIKAVGRTPARYIAREVGIHEQTVSEVINKRKRPSMKTLKILADRYL
jgi:DNA invertase Pin-like site-specific DNA recombinase